MKVSRNDVYAYSYHIKCPKCEEEMELDSKEDRKTWCYNCEEEIEIGD